MSMSKRGSRPQLAPEAGISVLELLTAAFLGILLVYCSGFLFTTQVRGYKDIKNQAKVQAGLKKALQGMTRQISTAGACLPNPRQDFVPEASRLSFAYVDLHGQFCPSRTTVAMTFRVRRGSKEDSLVQEIRCAGGASRTRLLAAAPGGGFRLGHRAFHHGDPGRHRFGRDPQCPHRHHP